ncbi:MAG: hypothetical protein ACE5EF_02915, partial [Dehalococcoidia bacterium]
MSLPIPNTPADFTPEWLTLALQESGHLSEGKVSAATTTDIGTGRGYVCQTVRINLEYEAAPESAPRSLVAKV